MLERALNFGPIESLLDGALDAAITVERPAVRHYLNRLYENHPGTEAAPFIDAMDKHYRRTVMGIGAAAGATAMVPGLGTGTALAAGVAEIGAFISATALYTMALADVYSIPTHDPEVRRALVLAVLVGEGSTLSLATGEVAARAGQRWSHVISRSNSKDAARSINTSLTQQYLARFGIRQGALMVGRALPMGIGAAVGVVGNAALAKAAIKSARAIFGPPPQRLPGRVIDL
jgi:hypothetical protein